MAESDCRRQSNLRRAVWGRHSAVLSRLDYWSSQTGHKTHSLHLEIGDSRRYTDSEPIRPGHVRMTDSNGI